MSNRLSRRLWDISFHRCVQFKMSEYFRAETGVNTYETQHESNTKTSAHIWQCNTYVLPINWCWHQSFSCSEAMFCFCLRQLHHESDADGCGVGFGRKLFILLRKPFSSEVLILSWCKKKRVFTEWQVPNLSGCCNFPWKLAGPFSSEMLLSKYMLTLKWTWRHTESILIKGKYCTSRWTKTVESNHIVHRSTESPFTSQKVALVWLCSYSLHCMQWANKPTKQWQQH